MTIDQTIGRNIKKIREQSGLLQFDLADELEISQAEIDGYERGEIHVTAVRLWEISRVFGVSIDAFFEGAGEFLVADEVAA